ncbi:hypothetical protein M2103_000796 [Ereboglobus sp. PH5-5]|uniref:metallophosphoesterase n=1 Tax=Ereboglobus sp. PH5-5 TaxID=2940529 RepID=UPI0024065F50|nr:metallophosphoesterase [Ereboglobus sp. PH5-5]MDF9832586.1 hypothetical protein [Ereboglobus sp. PH5-5]
MKKSLLAFRILPALALLAFIFSTDAQAGIIVNADFENGVPPEIKSFQSSVALDTTRARSGNASLRVTKKDKTTWGTAFFNLDGLMNFPDGCEFSLWVYGEHGSKISAYISAADPGKSGRYTAVSAIGTIKNGQWSKLRGKIYPGDLDRGERDVRLIIRTHGTCWIDDVRLTSGSSTASPAQAWPEVETAMRKAASRRVTAIKPGDAITLDARNAALVPDTALAQTTLPKDTAVAIPAEGILVFAIEAKDDITLAGTLQLEPDADLRPGLRATVLANNTVIAAPAVKADAPWRDVRTEDRPGALPNITGQRPSPAVTLAPVHLPKGRHYITVAGPHIRPGGTLTRLELTAKSAEKPLYAFGFFSDTHLGYGRPVWMNTKLNTRAASALETALRQLKQEKASFAIIGGDMTDGGRPSQYEALAGAVRRAGLPVYGCLGNHDTLVDARKSIAATIPELFPKGAENTDYDFTRSPVRFIVLNGSNWLGKGGAIQSYRGNKDDRITYRANITDWLRNTLAKDTATPTIVVSHYQFYLKRGVSDTTGYNLGDGPAMDKKIMPVLDAAPNVVATLNGHLHHNTVSNYHGIATIQNPAFAEWPNAYRVCRVYPDRMEWEVRQFSNRGLIREGVVHEKALLWMLSTSEGDLSGTVNFARRQTERDQP